MQRTQHVLNIGAVIGTVRGQHLVTESQFSAVSSAFRKYPAQQLRNGSRRVLSCLQVVPQGLWDFRSC